MICNGPPPTVLVVHGAGGPDAIRVPRQLPPTVSVRASGGAGPDVLLGSSGNDLLQSGDGFAGGNDRIYAGDGSDGVMSDAGHDRSFGQGGDDLMVTRWPCGGGLFDGGGGFDNGSFAEGPGPVHAVLGGTAVLPRTERCRALRLDDSIEGLEGTHNNDLLVGTAGPNNFFGQGGDDIILGRAGSDELVGAKGRDALFGGSGPDAVFGRDGRRDRRLDCGRGRDLGARRDKNDPLPVSCTATPEKPRRKRGRRR